MRWKLFISILLLSCSLFLDEPKETEEPACELRDIIQNSKDLILPIALGKSISGQPIVSDLSAMPHLLAISGIYIALHRSMASKWKIVCKPRGMCKSKGICRA